jgi:hypothetical protein
VVDEPPGDEPPFGPPHFENPPPFGPPPFDNPPPFGPPSFVDPPPSFDTRAGEA